MPDLRPLDPWANDSLQCASAPPGSACRPQKIANLLAVAFGNLSADDESQPPLRHSDGRYFDSSMLCKFAFEEFHDFSPPRGRKFSIESHRPAGKTDDVLRRLEEERPANTAHDNQQNYGNQNLHDQYDNLGWNQKTRTATDESQIKYGFFDV
jgi:hypothetical protein